MLVVTTDELPGHEVRRVLGQVIGATGRLNNAFTEGIRTLERGDKNPRISEDLARWRTEAVEQMMEAARLRGANAVVGMRFDHRSITEVWGEICAYGTAVYVVPVATARPAPGNLITADPGWPASPAPPTAAGTPASPATPVTTGAPPAAAAARRPYTGTAPPPTSSTWPAQGPAHGGEATA